MEFMSITKNFGVSLCYSELLGGLLKTSSHGLREKMPSQILFGLMKKLDMTLGRNEKKGTDF